MINASKCDLVVEHIAIERKSRKGKQVKRSQLCPHSKLFLWASLMQTTATKLSYYPPFSPFSVLSSLSQGFLLPERKRLGSGGMIGYVFQAWYDAFDVSILSHTSSRRDFDYFPSSLS